METIISRGSGNSRAKDFYDIVFLFEKISDSGMLIKNIREVFNHRNTDLPDSFFEFIEDLDFEILEVAWGSVQLSSRNMLFEECIRKSEKIFTTIDKLMKEF